MLTDKMQCVLIFSFFSDNRSIVRAERPAISSITAICLSRLIPFTFIHLAGPFIQINVESEDEYSLINLGVKELTGM